MPDAALVLTGHCNCVLMVHHEILTRKLVGFSGFVMQGVEVEHVIKSVMRKQAMAAQQAAQALASQQLSRVAAS